MDEKSALPVTESVDDKVVAPVTPRVPLMVALPPIEARLVTSKLLETDELVEVRSPRPVILFEPPVTAPPKVKALMVRVPELVD